jgi:hypothetical protein
MKNHLIIVLILSILSSCHFKTEKDNKTEDAKLAIIKTDSTFYFTLKDATDFIDSKSGTFTRQFVAGAKSVHFKFTKMELEEIKSLYFNEKLDTLPDNYVPNCQVNILPSFDEEYVIHFNGKQKSFTYNSDYECSDENDKKIVGNIKTFREYIINTLSAKKELSKLSYSDIVFF